MAGGILKTFGGILIAVGILAILAGGGLAAYGYMDAQEQRERGLAADRDRAEEGMQFVQVGLVAAGAGAIVLLVGIVLVATGSGRANRAIVKAVRQGNEARAASTLAPAPGSGEGAVGPQVAKASASAKPPASAQNFAAKTGSHGAAGRHSRSHQPQPTVSRKAILPWALGIVGAVAVAAGLALLLTDGGVLDSPDTGPGGNDDRSRDDALGTAAADGAAGSGATVLGGSQLSGGRQAEFIAAEGTRRVEAVLTWTPGDLCCERLEFYLEQKGTDGAWARLDSVTGVSGMHANYAVDPAKGTVLRLVAFPGQDGVSQGQEFHAELTFWAE